MKKTFILIVLSLSLFQLNGFGQKNKKEFVSLGQTEVGTLTASGQAIVGDGFEFPREITAMSIDPKTGTELVLIGGKGLACNLNAGQTLWEIKKSGDIFYQSNTNSFLVATTDGVNSSTHCFSMTDGEKKWNKGKGNSPSFYPLYQDTKSALIVGSEGYELRGVDANDGAVVWKRKLEDRDAGTPYHTALNDSTILVVTGGIHAVNLATGEGWSYKVKTGNKSLNKARNQRAIGGGFGLIGAIIYDATNAEVLLSYGKLSIDESENTVTFTNKEEQVKLSLLDGTLIEQTLIAKQEEEKEQEEAKYHSTYNGLDFKFANKMTEVYRDDKLISTLDISRIVFSKDNYLYGKRDKKLYRIDLAQLNN